MKNWKGVLAILLMFVLSLGFSLSAFAAETDALQLKSKSAVLMDAGTVVWWGTGWPCLTTARKWAGKEVARSCLGCTVRPCQLSGWARVRV